LNAVLYPFALEFDDDGTAARFPFIVDGNPVCECGGRAAPSCLVSGRAAGSMTFIPGMEQPVREAFFRAQDIPPECVYSLIQLHSRSVFVIDAGMLSPSLTREGDGMVSLSPEVFLSVTVADCLPVFLLDIERGFFAVLHSGWKGTGIAARALALMREVGCRPEAAVLGPCIQACCYCVDEKRARAFEAEFGGAAPEMLLLEPVSQYRDGGAFLDLQAANIRLLAGAGVRHIACCTDCTFTDERLGSYRREGPAAYTRMIAMAGVFSRNFPGMQSPKV
jgi:YfiH family protein